MSENKELTAERLMAALHYDPATGVFTRLVRSSNALAGDVAGGVTSSGYRYISVYGRQYAAHRLAWLYTHGDWPLGEIDHINGVKTDNRISNLRDCSTSENQQNRRRAQSNNLSSGLLGVTFHKQVNRWSANISLKGKHNHLGLFDNPEKAHVAYIKAKADFHPFQTLCKLTEHEEKK